MTMIVNNEFSDIMSKRTDEELIKIITIDREGYQPFAIEAAEYEIKNRGIDFSKVDEVKSLITKSLEEQSVLNSHKVGSMTRFLHFFIDTIAFILIMIIVAFVIGLFYDTDNQVELNIIGYSLLAISFFVYYIFMEYKYQKTIGKFITKTIVVTRGGQKTELNDIIIRTFCRLIPIDCISFLFVRNGFHDYLSETIVIKDEKYQ